MTGRWRDRLNQRLGEQVFLQAQKDLFTGTELTQTTGTAIARLLAIAILCLPPLLILFGLWLVWWSGFAWATLPIGGIIIASGVFLRPRPDRLTERSFGAEDLPAFFALLNAVRSHIDGPGIDRVILFDQLNAYARQTAKPRANVLGFGIPLWAVMNGPERVAVIAHELAHFQNNDPNRTGMIYHGLATLDRWLYLINPEKRALNQQWEDEDLTAARSLADIMLVPIVVAFTGLHHLLERLTYLESQRAEYLADTIGARVSGRAAAIEALELIQFEPLARLTFARAYPLLGVTGISFLASMRDAMRDPPEDTRRTMLETMRAEKSSVDQTHPPTVHRIAFLELAKLPNDPVQDFAALAEAAHVELAEHAERIGRDLLETRKNT